MTRVPACLVLLSLAALSASARETVDLSWRFTQGEALELDLESSLAMDVEIASGGEPLTERQVRMANTTYEVAVLEVRPHGGAELRLQLKSALLTLRSDRWVVIGSGFRIGGAEPAVHGQARMVPGRGDEEAASAHLASLMRALLDVRVFARIGATGVVESMRVEGDPFADDTIHDDPLVDTVTTCMRDHFDAEGMARFALAQTFQPVPGGPAEVGATWPVERAFPVLGLRAAGRGAARLASLRGEAGRQIAVIREDVPYAVDTTEWLRRRAEQLRRVQRQTGVDLAGTVALASKDGLRLVRETEFAPTPGCVAQTTWRDLTLEAAGDVALQMLGTTQSRKLTLRISGEGKARLERTERKLGNVEEGLSARELSPVERAVEDALRWLAAHQAPNGGWQAAGFGGWCDGAPAATGPDGAGDAHFDVGVTGLALCAFLAAGYTNRGRHPFAKTVSKGLRFLKDRQDAEGCFGPRSTTHCWYGHAAAALALVEAYGMTFSPIFKGSAQRALDFAAASRGAAPAWGYDSFAAATRRDVSITVEMMMALCSARLVNEVRVRTDKPAPFTIDEAAFESVRGFLDAMTSPETGRTGYLTRGGAPARSDLGAANDLEPARRYRPDWRTFPPERSEAMTAAALFTRIRAGEDPNESEVLRKSAALCAAKPPRWSPEDGSVDMTYWYWGTLALRQVGGEAWEAWKASLHEAVLAHQRTEGTPCGTRGSWDPVGPWGKAGGRVYATALMAMCLQAERRYDRIFREVR